ncbi:MAG: hypothetical protein CMO55_17110 [Verrucomicrobiales bacterium]|nr:hypothetical protein [Verrucomicrobiales bacterium]
MGSTDRLKFVWFLEEIANRGFQLVGEFRSILRDEPREVVALEVLPESFDGVVIRALGRKEQRM